ncbi:proteasome component M29 [Sporothrix epigloea]|uniref:Proteasome component M29 n=1 Tax=Sporothrix epigloea TaxID=1892477 RepID=A0ABP0E6V6_9PEZI
MAAPSPEQRELDLVEKVDLRILSVANNEAKLQSLLDKFLVPLLLKGASEHASVRAKVVTISQRLKAYIKPPAIVLPVYDLLRQFKSTESPVVRHLDIVFIQHSIGRLSVANRRALLPALFRGISKVNSSTPALFDILLQALAVLEVPPRGSQEDEAFAESVGLSNPEDAGYVAERLGKVFLLSRGTASVPQLAIPADVAFFALEQESSWLRTGTNLADIRVCIAHFLTSGAFSHNNDTETARFLAAIFAAVHSDRRVSSLGEDFLRRSKASLEWLSLVEQLYAAHAVLPPSYRIRILGLLCHSELAASYTDEIVKVVQRNMGVLDAMADSTDALQSHGLQASKLYKALFEYINWIARVGPKQAKTDHFVVGRTLIEYLQRYIASNGWPVPISSGVDSDILRSKAYETIGMLAVSAELTTAEQMELSSYLFRSLTEDSTTGVAVSIDSAISSLSSVFTGSNTTEVQDFLRALLLKYIYLADGIRDETQIRRGARHAAVKWANSCLQLADPIARWIDIVAVAGHRDERSDVIEEGRRGLDPWTHHSNNMDAMVLPKWEALVHTFFEQPICIASSGEMDIDGVSVFVNFSGEIIEAFPHAVQYCKQILLATALSNFKIEPAIILSKLYELHEVEQTEAHFAIGAAIAAVVACWDADVVELSLDVPSSTIEHGTDSFRISKRPIRLSTALDRILADSKTTKPALLKATGIWLFMIIQHCAHLLEVQSRLRACQRAFMRLLSARSELVQETASRGLALVYEKGDVTLKSELVRDLVAFFTGNGSQLKVNEDTELFGAGELPTSEGKSVTSYRDIVSLANEVGDQTLIYKFMSLANNAATWSMRSAFGRFGLSNILSSEGASVDPKLYPKLFRYRFDPNVNVQRSMNDIWKALVKDSKNVIDENFSAIMEDLLSCILSKEWRVRQASAAAVSDLVQGRPFVQYARFYHDIWACAIKVLDDVKGSVREAALQLCITLSNTLVRQLEAGDSGEGKSGLSKSAAAMMSEALPFLLSDKGIESGVEDVKVFSTVTVLKISKHGGTALRPYVSEMVPHLLGLLSTIEPQAFNYYYMRSGEDDREKLDKMRSAMVSHSPISEAIENSLCGVNADVLRDLVPGLETAIKNAVGMPTKIGCSRVIQTLATRHALDFAPYAPRFLRLLQRQLLDRNDEVSQSYAKSAAYVLRPASDAARRKFANYLVDLYFGADDESQRQKAADTVLAVAKISPDHFAALDTYLLPFVFVALHDTDECVRKAADEIWNNYVGSALTVTRYVPEIAALVERALGAAQWALKHAGARTSAKALNSVLMIESTGPVNVKFLKLLWPLYQSSMALKTFEGKEELLEVLPNVASRASILSRNETNIALVIRKMATVEAKRNNDAYRVHAFRCLWRVSAALNDDAAATLWNDLVGIVTPHLKAFDDLDVAMLDSKNSKSSEVKKDSTAATREKLVRQTAETALEAVARGYFRPNLQKDPQAVLAEVWNVLAPFLQDNSSYFLVRRTKWYEAGGELLQACSNVMPSSKKSGDVLALSYLASFDVGIPEAGTEDQRSLRAKALNALARACRHGVLGSISDEAVGNIKAAMEGALSKERSVDVQKLLREAISEAKK